MTIRKWALYLGVATMALSAAMFAACGGDDDDDGGASPSGATGSDEAFVASICKAGVTFSKDLDKVTKDLASLTDPKKAATALAGPFEDFSNAFIKAKPPKDLKDWHSDASAKLKEAVKALKSGDLESDIFTQDAPFPDPPKEAAARLTKVAEKNDDCKEADFSFGD